MTVERWMTEEWNRYCKGKGAPGTLVLLAYKDLFDAALAGLTAITREVPEDYKPETHNLVFKSARMYQLHQPGWKLVIEGKHGRQVGVYTAP